MWQEKYVDVFYCKPLQNVVASSREGEKKKKKGRFTVEFSIIHL